MEIEAHFEKIKRLKTLLRDALILRPTFSKGEAIERIDELFQDICNLIFSDDYFLQVWDEASLNQLQEFFKIKSPSLKVYGEQLGRISERQFIVKQINDFYFSVLGNEFSLKEVWGRLAQLVKIDESAFLKLQAAARLQDIRKGKFSTSEKIEALIEHLKNDIGVNFGEAENNLQQIIASIKAQEATGRVNALLVNVSNNTGTSIPLSIRLQPGKGEVHCLISGSDNFRATIERARHALTGSRFLNDTDDVLYSLDVTEASYSGDSIGLAAAIGMYAAAAEHFIDPYTAFTGNINLEGSQYRIVPVKGIHSKLDAALLNGCRRIFLPIGNQAEVDKVYSEKLEIVFSRDVTDVLLKLHPSFERLHGETLQVRKINCLKAHCQDNGWYLSSSDEIQDGLQFTISPPHPPELKINIYNSGTHTPKAHQSPDFQQVLSELAILDRSKVEIQKVNNTFLIKDDELRTQISEKLEALEPAERRVEQHCEYVYRFENGKEKIVIKQYTSGKLLLQGSAGELYKNILDIIIPLYNLKNPKAQLSIGDYLSQESKKETIPIKKGYGGQVGDIPLPHIGTDESGKGDYFGPMVIAGVWIDDTIKTKLESMGVKDSKLLSDKRCKELSANIRSMCAGKFVEVELVPERYNELYDQFKKEGKNLNHLLAWGHARAIESLLEKHDCSHAIADQFGDEKYILSKLMEKGKGVELIQTPKGERYIAVAAASILARDRFLSRLEKLSREYGTELPKGASNAVVQPAVLIAEKKGVSELKKVVKLHHKTTEKIVGKG